MADAVKMEKAREVQNALRSFLDKIDFVYTVDEEAEEDGKFVLRLTINGDDIPMNFIYIIDADRELISVYSPMPFKIPEEKRMEMAVAVCVATWGLNDGSFDYNILKGTLSFRQTVAYANSRVGEALFLYLVKRGSGIVDQYNDRFLALAKGTMSLDQFIEAE